MKYNYQYDYFSIRHTNIKIEIKKVYNQKIKQACIYNAITDRNIAPKEAKSKDWIPSKSDMEYAEKVYGAWENYDAGIGNDGDIDKMLPLFDVYCEPVEKVSKEEYEETSKKVKEDYKNKWNKNEGFAYNDRLNYPHDLVATRYNIFTDLFFREPTAPYKPTIEYNTWDDTLYLTDGRTLTKKMFRDCFFDYGSGYLIDLKFDRPEMKFIEPIYDELLRSDSSIYAYDPVKRYLDNLPLWDGEKRLETFLIKYQKADDTPAVREMTKLWFMNAVRAIYMPSKFPFLHMLVLQGESNCGKSATMNNIFKIEGRDRYQYEIRMDDAVEKNAPKFRTTWAIGFGERDGIDRVSVNRQKQFMDSLHTEMSYQKKYQNEITKYIPHNVVFVTTNDVRLLNDPTVEYNKRNWIIHSNITETEFRDKDYFHEVAEVRDQIWAEAKYYLSADWNCDLEPSAECIEGLKEIQKDYLAIDVEDVRARVNELLNRDFFQSSHSGTYHCFESMQDFIAQYRCQRPYADLQQTKYKIDRIPASYIKEWMRLNDYDSRYKRPVAEMLQENGFVLKRAAYGCNTTTQCWCKEGDNVITPDELGAPNELGAPTDDNQVIYNKLETPDVF